MFDRKYAIVDLQLYAAFQAVMERTAADDGQAESL
jgi:hypothetical protein